MSRRRIVLASLLVYPVLAALGLGWAAFRGRPMVLVHPEPWLSLDPLWRHAASLAGGALIALGTVALTRAWVARFRWARDLHVAFHESLGELRGLDVLVLALTSGIGEEVFFRGGVQPSLGWIATSVLFGIVHVGPSRRFWPWTLWALVFGLVVGALYEATGSLLGPILAHVWINHENLHHIVAFDPRAPSEREGSAPKLVGRSERR